MTAFAKEKLIDESVYVRKSIVHERVLLQKQKTKHESPALKAAFLLPPSELFSLTSAVFPQIEDYLNQNDIPESLRGAVLLQLAAYSIWDKTPNNVLPDLSIDIGKTLDKLFCLFEERFCNGTGETFVRDDSVLQFEG